MLERVEAILARALRGEVLKRVAAIIGNRTPPIDEGTAVGAVTDASVSCGHQRIGYWLCRDGG